jgi:erythromycin esterase
MKLITVIFLIFCSCRLQAQELKTYVKQYTKVVRTVSPLDTSYADLEALGKAIGDRRIVMLGEQDHGDAPAFLAKTRIIKYLREKKGFNVLAFESDFYALNQGLDLDNDQSRADSFTRNNIFGVWTYCDACAHLFYHYLPATRAAAQPLKLAGFDNQMVLLRSRVDLVKGLDSLLKVLDLPVTKRANYTSAILPALKDHYGGAKKDISATRQYVSDISAEITGKLPAQDFWMMVVQNLVAETDQYYYFPNNWLKGSNIRDSMMAVNLAWLAEKKYPEQKIIVWAANGHVAKYVAADNGKEHKAMGYFFTRDGKWKDQTYVLGFTSRKGEAGRLGWDTYKVSKPNPNGFENWIDEKIVYAFVDLLHYRSTYPNQKPAFHLKALGHNTNFTFNWSEIFDGVFYVRDMYPCKSINKTNGEGKSRQ